MPLLPRLRVAAYVICAEDDRLLLARWVGYDGPRWTLPGGGLDPGEQPRHGALRELAEETGYDGVLDALLGVQVERFAGYHDAPEGYEGIDWHAVRIVYRGRVTGGALTHEVDGSTDRAEWIARGALAGLDAVPLVAAGVAMLDADHGAGRIAPVRPGRAVPDGVRVEHRLVAYGHAPDGTTAGGLLDHGADPVETVAAAFHRDRGRRVTVLGPRDATSSVDPVDESTVCWTVRLDYDVNG